MSATTGSMSTKSTRGHRSWRSLICFMLPHLGDDEEIKAPTRRTSIDIYTEKRNLGDMAGIVPHGQFGQEQVSRPPNPAEQPVKKDVVDTNKPLPPLPENATAYVTAEKRVQFVDVRPKAETLEEEEEPPRELQMALTPPPLRVNREEAQNPTYRARSLSPVSEHRNEASSTDTNQPGTDSTSSKHPGSVKSARLAAEARLASAIRSATSTPSLRSNRIWQSTLVTSPNRRDFMNPRQAPSPPEVEPRYASSVMSSLPSNTASAGANTDAATAQSSTEKSKQSREADVSLSKKTGSPRAVVHLPIGKLKGKGRARRL